MANVEQGQNFGERNGARVRNVGIVIAILGLLPILEALVLPGVGLAASGEVFRRVSKKKQ
jgi:hypothetical protein